MTKLRCRSMAILLVAAVVVTLCFPLSGSAQGQNQNLYVDQEVRVDGLPSLMAKSRELTDVLPTSLDTILHDRSICCGRDSALEDTVAAADPLSLRDLTSKLQGRHLLGDGRPIQVTVEFWSPEAVNSGRVIGALTDKHALLMLWNSHLYVVYGVVYRWVADSSDSGPYTVIRKFLLLDTRFSDHRRTVVFNRETDDPSKVQGLLWVIVLSQ